MNTSILIPAYNEVPQIGKLLKELKTMKFPTIVVDDGSKDDTAKLAESNGAKVLRHKINRGKGASLKTGFEYILRKDKLCDAILIMDGDGQHSPKDIKKFTDLAGYEKDIFIIGNRMDNPINMPLERKLTNRFMSKIVSNMCRQNIPDSQCGFRLLKKDFVQKLDIEFLRFEVESELLMKASQAGFKIVSVPIQTLYGEESSRINPLQDTLRFIVFLFKHFFKKIRS